MNNEDGDWSTTESARWMSCRHAFATSFSGTRRTGATGSGVRPAVVQWVIMTWPQSAQSVADRGGVSTNAPGRASGARHRARPRPPSTCLPQPGRAGKEEMRTRPGVLVGDTIAWQVPVGAGFGWASPYVTSAEVLKRCRVPLHV